jgi:hypothetical protein
VELNAADVARLLTGIHADRSDLLNAVRPLITDSMLEEIASADYDNGFDDHVAALRLIRDRAIIPSPLRWEPREVCELIRWSRPHDPNWKPGATGRPGHIMRAFCCAVLLLDQDTSDNQSVAPALESTLFVPEIPPRAALSTFAALAASRDFLDEDSPLFALGSLLASLVTMPGQREPAESLIELCRRWDYTIRHNDRATLPRESSDWILGLTYYNLHHDTWRRAAKIVLTDRADSHHPALQSDLAEIAELIRSSHEDRGTPGSIALS